MEYDEASWSWQILSDTVKMLIKSNREKIPKRETEKESLWEVYSFSWLITIFLFTRLKQTELDPAALQSQGFDALSQEEWYHTEDVVEKPYLFLAGYLLPVLEKKSAISSSLLLPLVEFLGHAHQQTANKRLCSAFRGGKLLFGLLLH